MTLQYVSEQFAASPLVSSAALPWPGIRVEHFEQRLAFNPIHALEQHRPLGGVNRTRMQVYLQTQEFRQQTNGVPPAEPSSAAEAPD